MRRKILLHLVDGTRVPIDFDDIYVLEADGGETRVRGRGAEGHLDVPALGEFDDVMQRFGFVRIHRSFIVNPERIRLIRPREAAGWEVKLDPPVNRVLPVSRDRDRELWAAFGE